MRAALFIYHRLFDEKIYPCPYEVLVAQQQDKYPFQRMSCSGPSLRVRELRITVVTSPRSCQAPLDLTTTSTSNVLVVSRKHTTHPIQNLCSMLFVAFSRVLVGSQGYYTNNSMPVGGVRCQHLFMYIEKRGKERARSVQNGYIWQSLSNR